VAACPVAVNVPRESDFVTAPFPTVNDWPDPVKIPRDKLIFNEGTGAVIVVIRPVAVADPADNDFVTAPFPTVDACPVAVI
jgi:hypothetical protein